MKILHVAMMLSYSSGIYYQMLWEKEAAKKLDIEFNVILFCPKDSYPVNEIIKNPSITFKNHSGLINKAVNWILLRYYFYKWLSIEVKKYDMILLRYSVHDPFLLLFLMLNRDKLCTVHHTLELPELRSLGLIGKVRAFLDKVIGNSCIKRNKAIIGVTKEIVDYEKTRVKNYKKSCFVYPNGIDIDIDNLLTKNNSSVPQILFVASFFSEWHGLDILLRSLPESKNEFILHVIGDVLNSDKQLAMNDKRVVFHGKCSQNEIYAVSKLCCIGLSSFALHRKSMKEACTLKVREYLSYGLPVYSGHLDVFPSNFKFYKLGNADFGEIIEYSKQVSQYSRSDVRVAALPYIEKEIILKKLYDNLTLDFYDKE